MDTCSNIYMNGTILTANCETGSFYQDPADQVLGVGCERDGRGKGGRAYVLHSYPIPVITRIAFIRWKYPEHHRYRILYRASQAVQHWRNADVHVWHQQWQWPSG